MIPTQNRDSFVARFWSKVNKTDSCWLWSAAVSTTGYGRFRIGGRADGFLYQAHRVAYELAVGPIPDGLFIDHLCRVRLCVNPAHMEPVTNAENIRRGESYGAVASQTGKCCRGHSDWKTRRDGNGRRCMTCSRDQANAWIRAHRPASNV